MTGNITISIIIIKGLLNMILESSFSPTEWFNYGIVWLMVLCTLILLVVLKVD